MSDVWVYVFVCVDPLHTFTAATVRVWMTQTQTYESLQS